MVTFSPTAGSPWELQAAPEVVAIILGEPGWEELVFSKTDLPAA